MNTFVIAVAYKEKGSNVNVTVTQDIIHQKTLELAMDEMKVIMAGEYSHIHTMTGIQVDVYDIHD